MQAEETWPKSEPEEGRSSEFESELTRNRKVSDFTENHTLSLLELEPNKMSVSAPFGIDCDKCSSFTRLVRLTAFVQRFVREIRNITVASGPLTTNELSDVETLWLLYL